MKRIVLKLLSVLISAACLAAERPNVLIIFTSYNGLWNQPRYYLDKMGLLEGVAAKHVEGWYQEKDFIFWGSSGGLRGGKGSAYEGGSRVPYLNLRLARATTTANAKS